MNLSGLTAVALARESRKDLSVKLRVRLPGLPGNDAAVTSDLLTDKGAASLFDFAANVFIAGDARSLYQPRRDEHLNSVANGQDPLFGGTEFPNDFEQTPVITEILRGSAAENQDGLVVAHLYLIKADIGVETIAGSFNISVPSRFEIVHDKMETTHGGRGHYRLPVFFAEAVNGIQRLIGLAAIAGDDQNPWHSFEGSTAEMDKLDRIMKQNLVQIFCVLGLVAASGVAQNVIPLYSVAPPGSGEETYPEKEYFSKVWNTEVVSNVTKPTLTVYKPADGTSNGTGVVVCPGGGFMALSIASEGSEVAKWLAAKGVTAFVLKYRLAHTGEDATQEFTTLFEDKAKFQDMLSKVVPQSIADGLAAVSYVRKHAADFGISADRVGIIGFSAGGAVAAAVGFQYGAEGRPAFVAPIYGSASLFKDAPVPADAPPMFLAAATDDQLGLAPDSIRLYERWTEGHKSAELHMYAKGGHGFGMRRQGLPSDQWIDRFGDWLAFEGWLKK